MCPIRLLLHVEREEVQDLTVALLLGKPEKSTEGKPWDCDMDSSAQNYYVGAEEGGSDSEKKMSPLGLAPESLDSRLRRQGLNCAGLSHTGLVLRR